MSKKIKAIFAIAAITITALVIYIFMHEAGHALVALSCGAQITRLSILGAHTSWYGGEFTAFTLPLCHAAGALFPFCAAFVGILFYKKEIGSSVYRFSYFVAAIICASSLLVWLIFPVISLFTALPESEDATKFLQSSGLPPLAVSLGSAALIVTVILIAERKGIFHNMLYTMKVLTDSADCGSAYISGRTVRGLTLAVLVSVCITVLLELPASPGKPILAIATSPKATASDLEQSFDVPRSGSYQYQVQLDAGGMLTDIRILDETQNPIYQMLSEQASSNGTIFLEEGRYTLYISYLPDVAAFRQHYREMNESFDETAVRELEAAFGHEVLSPRLSFIISS